MLPRPHQHIRRWYDVGEDALPRIRVRHPQVDGEAVGGAAKLHRYRAADEQQQRRQAILERCLVLASYTRRGGRQTVYFGARGERGELDERLDDIGVGSGCVDVVLSLVRRSCGEGVLLTVLRTLYSQASTLSGTSAIVMCFADDGSGGVVLSSHDQPSDRTCRQPSKPSYTESSQPPLSLQRPTTVTWILGMSTAIPRL
jgi:hypothetical protein